MISAGAREDAVVWRLALAGGTTRIEFDDGVMVFNPLSWDTHLLNESAMAILNALGETPLSLGALMDALVGEADSALDLTLFRRQVQHALHDLEALGLVASTQCDA